MSSEINLKKYGKEGYLLTSLNLEGSKHMALDELLLTKSLGQENHEITARIDIWDGIYISLGKNQQSIPEKWLDFSRSGILKLIRRPSGGNAVLLAGGLTYSIIWSSPPRKRKEAYIQILGFHCNRSI